MKQVFKVFQVFAAFAVFSMVSVSSWAKNADDIVGKWKVISHLNGSEKAVVRIGKNKKNNTYYAQILSQTDRKKTCYKCPKPFTKKPIKGMMMVWNAKPTKRNAHVYKGGYGINPWNGRMFQGEFRLTGRNKDILKVKGFPLETKVVSRSFTWLRIK